MRILALALLLTTTAAATAQAPKEHLRFTLILSRHGIRPPLTPAATLNARSADPWPTWSTPLGQLTPHGAEALRQMGAAMRQDLLQKGLLSPTCPAPESIYLYADTDQRNIASTQATLETLAPHCGPYPVHTAILDPEKAPRKRDPFFLPFVGTFQPPAPESSIAAMQAALAAHSTPTTELNELARILAPDPAHPAAKPLLAEPVSITPTPSGDPIVSSHSPLAVASSLVENLVLEYADGRPMSEVGWGRADEATLRRLIPLHVQAFAETHRTPYFARLEASNTVAHILATLTQATGAHPSTDPIGPATANLVYISGHDTNLYGVAGLLGLHWTADGLTDDVPPNAQLVFELWQRGSRYTLRIRYRAQTLAELRNATAPTLDLPLIPTGCKTPSCPFTTFQAAATKTLNPHYIQPHLNLLTPRP